MLRAMQRKGESLKKYAVTCDSAFGKLWYYEADMPKDWWTPKKHQAMLFNTMQGAEQKAFFIVTKFPDLIGKVALFEGEEEDFGRKTVASGSMDQVLGEILGTLFGGKASGSGKGTENPPIQEDRPKGGRKGPPAADRGRGGTP